MPSSPSGRTSSEADGAGVPEGASPRRSLATRSLTTQSLAAAFDPRHNAFGFLRLFFASLVVVHHAFPLGGFGRPPLAGREDLGALAVDGFFVISGFLIVRSAQRLSGARYVWHRFLRIYPGYLVCIVTTALGFGLIAHWHDTGSVSGYLAQEDGPLDYVRGNLTIMRSSQNYIGDTLASNPFNTTTGDSRAWNGSLWTLGMEVRAYLVVLLVMLIKPLRRRAWPYALLAVGYWVAFHINSYSQLLGSIPGLKDNNTVHYTVFFMLGATLLVFAKHVPVNDALGVAAVCVAAASVMLDSFMQVGCVFYAYAVLWSATRLPMTRVGVLRDFSYGVYIYHFPVLQLLSLYEVQDRGFLTYLLAGFVGSYALAAASWYGVESVALRYKDARRSAGSSDLQRKAERPTETGVPPPR